MNEELKAYDIVFNHFNNCTCQDGRFPIRSALDTIYQALKRNEPMKPALDENSNHRCARCHHIVDNHYCSDCGGAVDWSDEK